MNNSNNKYVCKKCKKLTEKENMVKHKYKTHRHGIKIKYYYCKSCQYVKKENPKKPGRKHNIYNIIYKSGEVKKNVISDDLSNILRCKKNCLKKTINMINSPYSNKSSYYDDYEKIELVDNSEKKKHEEIIREIKRNRVICKKLFRELINKDIESISEKILNNEDVSIDNFEADINKLIEALRKTFNQ